MNRKAFIQFLVAISPAFSALSTLAACDEDAPTNPINPATLNKAVVILGAGIAGLAAARQLKTLGFKNIIVLEGRNRIGGRIVTDRSMGFPMDMGAAWIHGPNNNPIATLARSANAKTFVTADDSLAVFDENGVKLATNTVDAAFVRYETVLKKVKNNALVSKSVRQVIVEQDPSVLNDLLMQWQLTTFAEFDAGGDIAQLSSKYWDEDENFAGADAVLPNGYDAITAFLAREVADIRLNQTVLAVDYVGEKIKITTDKGTFEADRLICTVPLGVLKNNTIAFTPEWPTARKLALNRLQMGVVNKVVLTFDRKFWGDEQYIGFTDSTKGKFPYFLNLTKVTPLVFGLVAFSFGNYASQMEALTDAQIQAEIMATLRKIYGLGIPNPTKLNVSRWQKDPFSRGAYSFQSVNSLPEDFTELATPINGKLFFAGEHTNLGYRGTVHGAFLSGERVAVEISRS